MRSVRISLIVEAVGDASESRIIEAVIERLRQSLPPRHVTFTTTEDGARVRVLGLSLAGASHADGN